jgi:hypothetical protein
MIHLSSGISDDLDIFREEIISELFLSVESKLSESSHTKPKSAGKVFFFARSPEAPRTTMMVFSLSSIVLPPVSISILAAIWRNGGESGRGISL